MAPSVGVKLLTSRKISVNLSSRCGPSWPPDLELTSLDLGEGEDVGNEAGLGLQVVLR